eukprot:6207263-Pleurochrysis_carterae.AAC.2
MDCVTVLLEGLAAVIREPSHSTSGEVAMVVSKERVEAVLNFSSSRVAQVVDLKVLDRQV